MGLFGFIKDVILLPVDIALDITGVTPITRAMNDFEKDSPFGTVDRLESLINNLDDTKDV
jgi:hypothetical protein